MDTAPRACSVSFATFFLLMALVFWSRGRAFVEAGKHEAAVASQDDIEVAVRDYIFAEADSSQEQEPDPESTDDWAPTATRSSTRTSSFHLLVAMATFDIACSYLLATSGIRSPFFVPWRYCGRILATPLLVAALGLACCASISQALPAMALAALAWIKLGLAATSRLRRALRVYAFFAGLMSGWFSYNILDSARQSSLHGAASKIQLRTVLDLFSFCGLCYALVWLATEGTFLPTPPMADILLNGFVDVLCFVGCGHLLLSKNRWQVLVSALHLAAE